MVYPGSVPNEEIKPKKRDPMQQMTVGLFAVWRSLFARMDRSVLQDARFQPAPDQTDQARITDSMLDTGEPSRD